ncbi:CPBP family intramembrane glutamic endopeptidase [Streptosporangium carneum]|nr:CPBP family intramembrane glutamic endopeptidase [Streptosporangium carneum]
MSDLTPTVTIPVELEEVKQYRPLSVLAVWAAAAVPMGVLAWVVVPAVAGQGATVSRFAVTLIAALTVGLVWQCVLALSLVAFEQRSLRWAVVRDALWLRAPSDPSGRRGGRLWLWTLAFGLGFMMLQFVPFGLSEPTDRSLGEFLNSPGGQETLHGNWGLFALVCAMMLFNTVAGEELLFRGLLLPRMRGAFGRADWVVNGVLTGLYHLHQPWSIPGATVAGTFLLAYPTRRFRSAWMGIAVHSMQSVFFAALVFMVVIR